jgi:molecular chaperone GrpE
MNEYRLRALERRAAIQEHTMTRRHSEGPADEAGRSDPVGEAQPATNGPAQHDATEGDVQAQLSEEKARADGYLSQWQRAVADYQNLKRRTEQEREEYGRLANMALIINILPAVDDLNRALANVDTTLAGLSWVEGIRAIQRKLAGALEASGVTEIRAEGQEFDPNVHEAISHAPGERDRVVAEAQRGYKLGNRVIRPAMVVVGNGEADGPGTQQNDTSGGNAPDGKPRNP